MPLKLNLGVSKKVGLPDYGSLGASCHVEVELDGSLVFKDLEAFHARVRQAYVACHQAVADELARHHQHADAVPTESNGHSRSKGNGNGASAGNGNGHRATTKQLSYARQLAGQITDLGARRLESVAQQMFGKPLAGLSSLDASGLIDALKEVKAGNIDLTGILDGVAS